MCPSPEEHIAYIAVGSNIEPHRNIVKAFELLARHATIEVVSTFYRTKPTERPEQPDFRNGVIRVRVTMDFLNLKYRVSRRIEQRLGRVRTNDPHAMRTIDLDVILFDDLVYKDRNVSIPDPAIRTQSFVAVPLLELADDLVLPDTGESLAALPSARETEELHPDKGLTRTLRKMTRQ